MAQVYTVEEQGERGWLRQEKQDLLIVRQPRTLTERRKVDGELRRAGEEVGAGHRC